jgi:ADP-ribose pyrophosphatase
MSNNRVLAKLWRWETLNDQYQSLLDERPALFRNLNIEHTISIITNPVTIRQEEVRRNVKIGILYQDEYLIFLKDLVMFPNGSIGTYIRILPASTKSGVVILPILNDRVVMLRHFRHSTRRIHLELPRGFAKDDMDETENAVEEILEETGFDIVGIEKLGEVHPDTGILASKANVYCATLSPGSNHTATDIIESICKVEFFTLAEIKMLISEGEISDGYTLSALAMFWVKNNIV